MTIEAVFDFENHTYKFSRSYQELDRNYSDESYVYFIEERPNTEAGFFEINILKDEENNKMIEKGYVAIYDNTDQTCPNELINANIKITYRQNV